MTASKVFCSVTLLMVMVIGVFATAQEPDHLRISDLEYDLSSNPLEQFFKKDPAARPSFWVAPLMGSSGNNRGYLATWEIRDEKLYLVEIDSWFCGPGYGDKPDSCRRVTLADILGQQAGGKDERFAEWYTGQLRVPEG